jgi:hypothetical protein
VNEILDPWLEVYKKNRDAAKAKSTARKMAGAPKPEPEPEPPAQPATKPQAPAPAPQANSAPIPDHVRAANPWVDVVQGVNPDDYGAASKAVATQGGKAESADEFVDAMDPVAETERFLGREPGDEPPEEFEEEPPF